ncbi:MAG TPA: hypothetical protein VFQ36_15950 [Ktedonobacteraceae bacterium]|nr:hypothetical protein [Ktedonobacteraceae bacterium]
MDEPECKSEVARVMRQIDLELEAAQRGLSGYAISARHDFINARMQRGGERILRLIDEGKHEEAQALMNTDNWGVKGRTKDDATTPDGTIEGKAEEKQEIKKDDTQTSA